MSKLESVKPLPQSVDQFFTQAGVTIPGHTTGDTNFNPGRFPSFEYRETQHGIEVWQRGTKLAFVPMTNVKVINYK